MFDWIFGFLGSGLNSIFKGWFDTNGGSDLLPGSSFHAITAAFATQGYWAQADFIYFINETGFQSFAVLIYLCALIAGVVGMAMGAPPKQYLWYFMGPALFHFLLGTTQPVYGTAWKVGGTVDYQFEVWKLAETGLQSTNIAKRDGIKITAYEGPSEPVNVSWFFAQFDAVVSATVETFIGWLGVNLLDGDSDPNSNTIKPPSPDGFNTGGRWHLISNLKWGYLDTIASARLSSPELRDGFINFMAGRCGDEFQASIDAGRYMSATKSESGTIPAGIFTSSAASTALFYADPANASKTYKDLDDKMGATSMPMPIAFRKLFPKTSMIQPTGTTTAPPASDKGSLEATLRDLNATFINPGTSNGGTSGGSSGTSAGFGDLQSIMQRGEISCRNYLDILVKGFRWEAANVYYNLERQLPPGSKQTKTIGNGIEVSGVLEYAMLYGWEVQKYKIADLFGTAGSKTFRDKIMEARGETVDYLGQNQYLINLIFINMLKNEFLLAPNAMARKVKFLSSEQSSNAIEMYQKTVGSRNKFGEIYSWARMMPYLQGLLLYILALGYPFACVMILLPRCSKILFTWSSFWIWAKLWDLGFAIVVILERSVWATIGNSAKATQMNPFIVQIADWSITKVGALSETTLLPTVTIEDLINKTGPLTSYMYLDRAMTLFSNMDLDLQNSFYIYIMAALYFAVPAITGQLVLGGKASVAGMVTGAFQNMAQEVGGRAGRAFSQQLSRQAESANQAVDQALYAKNLANGGLLAKALDTQNRQAAAELAGMNVRALSEGMSNRGAMLQNVQGRRNADSEYAFQFTRGMMSNPAKVAGTMALFGAAGFLGDNNPLTGIPATAANQANNSAGAGEMRTSWGATGSGASNGQVQTTGGGQGVAQQGMNSGTSTGPFNGSVNQRTNQPSNGAIPQNGISAQELWNGGFWSPMSMGVDMAGRMNSYGISRQNTDAQAAIIAARSGYSVDGFALQAEGQQLQREGQYLMAEAKGTAQSDSWYEKNAYANQFAQDFGALEVSSPQIGPKPTEDMYLARSGLAGSAAQTNSEYFKQGTAGGYESLWKGYHEGVKDKNGNLVTPGLTQAFGSDSMFGIYTSRVSNPTNELALGMSSFNQLASHLGANFAGNLQNITDPSKIGQIISQPFTWSNISGYEVQIDPTTNRPVTRTDSNGTQHSVFTPIKYPRKPSELPSDIRPPTGDTRRN